MSIQVLRRPAVERRIGLSRAQIYALMSEGSFPRPIKIGRRAVGWIEADIIAWIDEKLEASKREGNK